MARAAVTSPQAVEMWTGETQSVVVRRTFVERQEDAAAQEPVPARQHGSAPEVMSPERQLYLLRNLAGCEDAQLLGAYTPLTGQHVAPETRAEPGKPLPALLLGARPADVKVNVKHTFIHMAEEDEEPSGTPTTQRRHTWTASMRRQSDCGFSSISGTESTVDASCPSTPHLGMEQSPPRRGSRRSRLSDFSVDELQDMIEAPQEVDSDCTSCCSEEEAPPFTPTVAAAASWQPVRSAPAALPPTLQGVHAAAGPHSAVNCPDNSFLQQSLGHLGHAANTEQSRGPQDQGWQRPAAVAMTPPPPNYFPMPLGAQAQFTLPAATTAAALPFVSVATPAAPAPVAMPMAMPSPTAMPSPASMPSMATVLAAAAAYAVPRQYEVQQQGIWQAAPVSGGTVPAMAAAIPALAQPGVHTANPFGWAAAAPWMAPWLLCPQQSRVAAANLIAAAAAGHFPSSATPGFVAPAPEPRGVLTTLPMARSQPAAPPPAARPQPVLVQPQPAGVVGEQGTPRPAPAAVADPGTPGCASSVGSEGHRSPKNNRGRRLRLWAHIYLHMQDAPDFDLVPRIIGRKGCNMRRIAELTGAKLRIRGRGSGHFEVDGKAEAPTPLMVAVTTDHQNGDGFQAAVQQTLEVLKLVAKRFEDHCKRIKHKHEGPHYSVGLLPPNAKEILGTTLEGVPQSGLALQAEQQEQKLFLEQVSAGRHA